MCISVIVRVYKVEPYLRRCVDSILSQTYQDLDVILVDDGSPDACGMICDEYAAADSRVRVIHKQNGGLSSSRNAGMRIAKGEYIAFVDSDDWIEPDMYETMIYAAREKNADMVSIGHYIDFTDHTDLSGTPDALIYGEDILTEFIKGTFGGCLAWNKLYKKEFFDDVEFPDGQNFEDFATIYKVTFNMNCAVSLSQPKYHYIQRGNSIVRNRSLKNVRDFWRSHNDWFNDLSNRSSGTESSDKKELLYTDSAKAISFSWRFMFPLLKEDKQAAKAFAKEVSDFARNNFKRFNIRTLGISVLLPVILAQYNNTLSMAVAYYISTVYKAFASSKGLF